MQIVPPIVGKGNGVLLDDSLFYDSKFPIMVIRGTRLPHLDQTGKLQFVTFRLKDSLPSHKLTELKALKEKYLNGEEILDFKLQRVEKWISSGLGDCILKYKETQEIIIKALNFYDGFKFDLYDYVIMPNHVHMVILPYEPINEIIINLKRFTAKGINKILGRTGKVWQSESFDRIIRNIRDYYEISEYIKENPKNFNEKF